MSRKRDVLQKIVDSVSDETLEKVFPKLMKVFDDLIPIDNEELTEEEVEAIKQAEEEYARGEVVTLDELKETLDIQDSATKSKNETATATEIAYVFKTEKGYIECLSWDTVRFCEDIHKAEKRHENLYWLLNMAEIYRKKSGIDVEVVRCKVEHIYTQIEPKFKTIRSDYLEALLEQIEAEKLTYKEIARILRDITKEDSR